MEVAVGIGSHNPVVLCKDELSLGGLAGLELLALVALLALQGDPLDIVLLQHGVGHLAHLYRDLIAVDRNHGDMLLRGGIHRPGDQLLHLLAATHDRHAAVVDKGDDISAMRTDIEFHGYAPFRNFWKDLAASLLLIAYTIFPQIAITYQK